MSTQKLTKLEEEVLLAVITPDHQEGKNEGGANTYRTWHFTEEDINMKRRKLSDAISNCVKKGYVGVEKDSTIWITEKGYDTIVHTLEFF